MVGGAVVLLVFDGGIFVGDTEDRTSEGVELGAEVTDGKLVTSRVSYCAGSTAMITSDTDSTVVGT